MPDSEKIVEFYSTHSRKETLEHFGISQTSFYRIIGDYKKPKEAIKYNNKGRTHESYVNGGKKSALTQKKNWENKSDTEKKEWAERCRDAQLNMSEEDIKNKVQKALDTYNSKTSEEIAEINKKRGESVRTYWDSISPDDRRIRTQDRIEKTRQTCLERYGVEFSCMREEARMKGNDSQPNKQFAKLLELNHIDYDREFCLDKYSYDFRVGIYLIEINPAYTHNITISPFGREPISKDYHKLKTQCAEKHGYHCIHIFDWDDAEKIIQLFLQKREMALARSCEVVYLDKETSSNYINKYHLQSDARDEIRMGLVEKKSKELISVMTFGKPRYNKKYDWELIRYCAHKSVVGGASKLFSHFIADHPGESVISYCDLSKFSGEVYDSLGFKKINSSISAHWYNPKTGVHITDNLLRQRGFDQLLGEEYGCFGKGTSNEELMVQHGFVKIYDAGQATYIFSNGV